MATKKTTKPRKPAQPKAANKNDKPTETQPQHGGKLDSKMSMLDAAAKVLAEAGESLTTKTMIQAMATKGYWTSPGGKTPHATLYAAIIREIAKKGNESRFKKTDRGQFSV